MATSSYARFRRTTRQAVATGRWTAGAAHRWRPADEVLDPPL